MPCRFWCMYWDFLFKWHFNSTPGIPIPLFILVSAALTVYPSFCMSPFYLQDTLFLFSSHSIHIFLHSSCLPLHFCSLVLFIFLYESPFLCLSPFLSLTFPYRHFSTLLAVLPTFLVCSKAVCFSISTVLNLFISFVTFRSFTHFSHKSIDSDLLPFSFYDVVPSLTFYFSFPVSFLYMPYMFFYSIPPFILPISFSLL